MNDSMRQNMGFIEFFQKKITKYHIIIWLVFTVLLAALITLGKQIVYIGDVHGRPYENYLMPLSSQTLINFIVAFLLMGIIGILLLGINHCYQTKLASSNAAVFGTKEKIIFCAICFLVIFLAWLPYLLSYLPGILFVDVFDSISQAVGMDVSGFQALNNHHPIFYTLLWRWCIVFCGKLGLNLYRAIEVFLVAQFMLTISIMTYLLYWLRKNGLHVLIVMLLLILVSFFPLFPLIAIRLWKDSVFSLLLLLFALTLGEYAFSDNNQLLNKNSYLIKLAIIGLLVCFLRNNGKYIVFASLLVILLLNVRHLKNMIKYIVMAISIIILVQGIQGPLYDHMNFNTDTTVESYGIPIQQMAYLVYYDYHLSEEELAYIDQICPIQEIKDYYNPCLFDVLKWSAPGFNIQTIENDKALFFLNYLKMILKHPIGATKGFMLATAGIWAPNIPSVDGYDVAPNGFGIERHDYLQSHFGFSIKDMVEADDSVYSAVFLFIMFFAAFVVIFHQRFRLLIVLLPAFLNWLTIMIATPVACSIRYVYILTLIVPIDVFLICIASPDDGKAIGKRTTS